MAAVLVAVAAALGSISPLNNPCLGNTNWSSQPWCDHRLGYVPLTRRGLGPTLRLQHWFLRLGFGRGSFSLNPRNCWHRARCTDGIYPMWWGGGAGIPHSRWTDRDRVALYHFNFIVAHRDLMLSSSWAHTLRVLPLINRPSNVACSPPARQSSRELHVLANFLNGGAPSKMVITPRAHVQSPHASLCSVDARVADMIGRMTIQEKIANLDTQAPAIASLGLNAYKWVDRRTPSTHLTGNNRLATEESAPSLSRQKLVAPRPGRARPTR